MSELNLWTNPLFPAEQRLEYALAEIKRLDAGWSQANIDNLVLEQDNATLRQALKNHAEEAAKMVSAEPVAYGVNCSNTGRLCFLYNASDEEDMEEVEDFGDAAFPLYTSPRIPEGWVMVPRKPTDAMCTNGLWSMKCPISGSDDPGDIYTAMIAAAPKPE